MSVAPAESGNRRFPRFYAMTLLGFVTGLRPSSLRPLRRSGSHADLKWDDRILHVRRSQTRGNEVMAATKTGRDQRILLPAELVEILRAHVASLTGKRRSPMCSSRARPAGTCR